MSSTIDISSALARLRESNPHESAEVSIKVRPDGSRSFVAAVGDVCVEGEYLPREYGFSGESLEAAVEDCVANAKGRPGPAERRARKIEQLRKQISELEVA